VLVPAMPLASGSRELSLEAQDPTSNKIQLSDDVVVIAVPERNAGGQSIAILTPRKGGGASKVLQAPRPKPTPQAAPSPTPTAAPTAAPTATPKPSPAVASASVVAAQVVANVTTEQAARASTPPPPVSLDSVDYDDTGSLILAGRADAGTPVNVYVDNKLVGGVKATAGGKWQITPQSNVQPGDHKLRVDQTDASGKVQYRVELPFSRAEPAAIKLVRGQVIVQPGNSLWRIARHSYGSGTLYSVIYEANRSQIRDPDLIYPGQIFKVPTAGGSDG
jgi:nucleoid-associated protein YgaU